MVSRRGLACEGRRCGGGLGRGEPSIAGAATVRVVPERRGVKVAYPRLSSRSVVATSPVSIHAAGKLSARWCGEAELEVVGDQWQRVERDREGREPCKGRER
ncbi:hypothetical protein DEO72_LG6g1465 [Vigna unguiculata]|uniref:Uncharacterized protein n=1 Tax=Vigna unguiculata TaxID=3917 RepID=A0A4D6M9H1_VIGUN|nr:hypothetical protein DEO72_LG6g1465 [Vigna unguiculata]